jgi:WD40 repeat protein
MTSATRLVLAFLAALPALADTSPPATTFNPTSAGVTRSFEGHRGAVRAIAVSADGRMFASLGVDRAVKLWPSTGDKPTRTVSGTFQVERLWLSTDGRTMIGQEAQNLVVVDTTNDQRTTTISNVVARGFAVSPDGKRIITTTRAARVTIFSTQTGEELSQFEGPNRVGGAFAWSPDGKRIAEMGNDRVGRIWDSEKGEQLATLENVAITATALAYSPDGKTVALAGVDGTVRLFDGVAGKEKCTLGDRSARPQSLAWSRSGSLLASGHYDGSIRLWDPKTGREIRRLDTGGGTVWSLAFTPDGRSLISGTNDGRITVWGRPRIALGAPVPTPRAGKPGFLGVTADTTAPGPGVKVKAVAAGSAAEKAGLKEGDTILKAGGKDVASIDELRAVVTALREGDELELKFTRDGTEQAVKAKLGARAEE